MRSSNEKGLDAIDMSQATVNGPAISLDMVVALSVHSVSTSTGVGTIKVQVSNDPPGSKAPSNWADLSGATISVTAASSLVLPKIDVSYQWCRLVYTKTSGSGSLTARIKSIGF